MPWVNTILRKLFAEQKKEAVKRKEKYEFSGDVDSYEPEDLHAFAEFMIDPEMWFINQYEVVSLHTPQSQGIVLKSNEKDDYDFFEAFMAFFKDRLTKNPKLYYNPVKEVRFEETDEYKKNTVFVYLKPAPVVTSDQGKHDQMYGQISLSLINFNDIDYSLKIQVNYYSGFQYSTPKHLKELMSYIAGKTI